MIKRVVLRVPYNVHKAMKLAAINNDTTMNQFICDAIAEKLGRQPMERAEPTLDTLDAKIVEHSAPGVLAEDSEKPVQTPTLVGGN